jgi:hypothetical protein
VALKKEALEKSRAVHIRKLLLLRKKFQKGLRFMVKVSTTTQRNDGNKRKKAAV